MPGAAIMMVAMMLVVTEGRCNTVNVISPFKTNETGLNIKLPIVVVVGILWPVSSVGM